MTQGLYLKANGEMPCWDDVGEQRILRKLDPQALADGSEKNISNSEELLRLRQSFLDGAFPNPGLCERCAVKNAGPPAIELNPSVLQVLHVEPSYLCHLSCPQCIPQKLRKSLKDPPYHLTPPMYEGFLKQLRAEGIQEIKLVIFEGRGDPLTSPHMEDLVRITKTLFPTANTCITTHGSFPYKPWIIGSKLDIIRFSIDGAFQKNYEKYRVGGKLNTILNFIRSLRDDKASKKSRLYIEWKYILFEWNDSDEELIESGKLAQDLGVRLRFCRTHTPGRSLAYTTAGEVNEMIARLVPWASEDLTFQLKVDGERATVDAVKLDQIRGSMVFARQHHEAGDQPSACASISDVLSYDGGLGRERVTLSSYDDLATFLCDNIERISLPETAAELAAFCNETGIVRLVPDLLRHYLYLAPDAANRDHVEADVRLLDTLAAERLGLRDEASRLAIALIESTKDDDDPLMSSFGKALGIDHPGVVVGLANLYAGRGHAAASMLLFERYIQLAPNAKDIGVVLDRLSSMRAARDLDLILRLEGIGHHRSSEALIGHVALNDAQLPGEAPVALTVRITQARRRATVEALRDISLARHDFEAAYIAERRLRTDDSISK